MSPSRGFPLALELAIGLMLRTPRKHRLCEDIVKDLVPNVPGLLDRPQNAPFGENFESRTQLRDRDVSEVSEVGDFVRNLRARGCDEMIEEPARDVLLLRRKIFECAVQVLLDNALGAAKPLEGSFSKDARARRPFLVPQALEHELEVGRLDTAELLGSSFDRSETAGVRARSVPRRLRRESARPARARRSRSRRRVRRSDRAAERWPHARLLGLDGRAGGCSRTVPGYGP